MNKQVMTPERKAAILARMPVHAFGDTRDLGAMAKFLISDGATYITGRISRLMEAHWLTDIDPVLSGSEILRISPVIKKSAA